MSHTWFRQWGLAAVLTTGALAPMADTALAASPRASQDGSIKACSRNGHGCVSAPVRQGRRGMEVRLPGGSWIGCAGDCRDTLVNNTVDYWDKLLETAPEPAG